MWRCPPARWRGICRPGSAWSRSACCADTASTCARWRAPTGGQARAAIGLTEWADRWLTADASDTVRRAVQGELAELHTTTAWCCHDGAAPARTLHHFGRASMLDDSPSVLVQSRDELAKARDGWVAPDAFAAGDMHLTSA